MAKTENIFGELGGGVTHVECATGSNASSIGFSDLKLSNDGTFTLATYASTTITVIKKCTVYINAAGTVRSEVAEVGQVYTRQSYGYNYLLVDDQ